MTPLFTIKQEPKPATTAKPAPHSATNGTSAQAASAFSAHLKKSQAAQASQTARQHRREVGSKGLATCESELRQSAVDAVGENVEDTGGQDQQSQQNQQDRRQQHHSDDEQGSQDHQETVGRQTAQRLETLSAIEELATEALVEQLAERSSDDGMFEVLQPDGNVLSVAITQLAGRVAMLLNTSSVAMNTQLRRSKMELEQRLGRRIGKDVVVTVL